MEVKQATIEERIANLERHAFLVALILNGTISAQGKAANVFKIELRELWKLQREREGVEDT